MEVPPAKRPRTDDGNAQVTIRLLDPEGVPLRFARETAEEAEGRTFNVSSSLDREGLHELLASIREQTGDLNDAVDLSFYVPLKTADDGARVEMEEDLLSAMQETTHTGEDVLPVICVPRDEFTVRPMTRCAQKAKGHADSVLCAEFAPGGKLMATGGGDGAVRFWDTELGAPLQTLKRHKHWIQVVKWSTCGRFLASGAMSYKESGTGGEVCVWDPRHKQDSSAKAHNCVTLTPKIRKPGNVLSLCWQPLHLMDPSKTSITTPDVVEEDDKASESLPPKASSKWPLPLLAVGYSTGLMAIFDVRMGRVVASHTVHSGGSKKDVMDLAWSGKNVLYSAGRDGTIVSYNVATKAIDQCKKHNHWVNCLALNSGHLLRAGCIHAVKSPEAPQEFAEAVSRAKSIFDGFLQHVGQEILASGSDDNKIFLYQDLSDMGGGAKMLTGHQHPINHLVFSPDGRYLASASFDKTVRLWNGTTGKFYKTFRGHVGRVYKIAWAPDSRWIISASQDSTMKLWDAKKLERRADLPGHLDEVYCLDWSLDGRVVATGGKDQTVMFWRH